MLALVLKYLRDDAGYFHLLGLKSIRRECIGYLVPDPYHYRAADLDGFPVRERYAAFVQGHFRRLQIAQYLRVHDEPRTELWNEILHGLCVQHEEVKRLLRDLRVV